MARPPQPSLPMGQRSARPATGAFQRRARRPHPGFQAQAPRPSVWSRLLHELGYVAGLRRLWLAVAVVGFVAGLLLGLWFGHELALQARLR